MRARPLLPHLRPQVFRAEAEAWVRDALTRRRYRTLTDAEIVTTRRSDTVFIFGSGYSINDISPGEWRHFSEHDTLSFNWFPYQRWVRIDYHFIREVAPHDFRPDLWRPALNEYADLLRNNPHYRNAVFIIQRGWRAINGNRFSGFSLLPDGARIFRFKNRARHHYEPPSESFAQGLAHSATTLGTCVNFAYLMGWRTIVMVGVDLYDHRYFWLGPNEARATDLPRLGRPVTDPFAQADRIVGTLGTWGRLLAPRGVTLLAYNPRSLLCRELPVYERPAESSPR